jgi:hypothetical protein
VCPYCGADYRSYQQPAGVTDGRGQLQAQVEIATNTRRIALVLILATFLSIGTVFVFLAISVFYSGDLQGAKSILATWIVFALVVMFGGFYVILSDWRPPVW